MSPKNIFERSLRSLFIAALTLQVTWYAIGTHSFFQKKNPEGVDFRWFYAVGKVFREYGPSHVYDLDLARIYQAQVAGAPVGTVRLALPNHPPFVYPLVALLAGLDFRNAYYCYLVLILLITTPLMVVVYRSLRKENWPRLESLIVVVSLVLFEPFFTSLLRGQDTYLLFLGGLFLLSGRMLEKDWLAGLGLGLMLIRPQIGFALALPFLFRQRKIWWWFLATAAVLGMYSFAQVGWTGAMKYLHVLSLSTGVEGFGWDEVGMFNLVGLLIRIAPGLDLDVVHAIGWGFYAVTLAGLGTLWRWSKSIRPWHLALAVVLSLFAAPHLHYYDLALLAIPIVGLGVTGVKNSRFKVLPAAAMLTMASLFLLAAELWEQVHNIIPYLLMAALPVFTWLAERERLTLDVKT